MANKNKIYWILFLVAAFLLRYLFLISRPQEYTNSRLWNIQSIDVMKYSRDLAREKLNDNSFDKVIESQTSAIASTGATHIAIGVPYDNEFLPFMRRWVVSARRNGLNVWFRGNFSGWEGWFEYLPIDRATHTKMTEDYIVHNADLFEDGDLFSSCPECENGGPGDPRQVGGVPEYRNFLVQESDAVRQAFRKIGKNIPGNLHSMNGDVARLVMNKETTQRLGGIVVIDHYVATPEKLVSDIKEIAASSGGQIFLGEFGAPIPDIHGDMSDEQQAAWLSRALGLLAEEKSCIGLSYWTGFGGSTKLWNDNGSEKLAANVVRGYFHPTQYQSQVITWGGLPVPAASVQEGRKLAVSASTYGFFSLPLVENMTLTVSAPGFQQYRTPIGSVLKIKLEPTSLFSLVRVFL